MRALVATLRAGCSRGDAALIVGSGIDVIEIARIERALARHGERFLGKVLTPAERLRCAAARRPAPLVAACFAAKEALMKAVGTGWARGVRFADIETSAAGSGAGRRVEIRLAGQVAEHARVLGGDRCWLAVTRSRTHAVAIVLLESA